MPRAKAVLREFHRLPELYEEHSRATGAFVCDELESDTIAPERPAHQSPDAQASGADPWETDLLAAGLLAKTYVEGESRFERNKRHKKDEGVANTTKAPSSVRWADELPHGARPNYDGPSARKLALAKKYLHYVQHPFGSPRHSSKCTASRVCARLECFRICSRPANPAVKRLFGRLPAGSRKLCPRRCKPSS
eukprot:1192379-Prorocentrum_minimum.AAC.2